MVSEEEESVIVKGTGDTHTAMCNVTRVRTAAEHVDIVKDGGPYFQATFFWKWGWEGSLPGLTVAYGYLH